MEINEYLHHNLYKYKRRLSPLGQKILHNLFKQWKIEHEHSTNCLQRRHEPIQKKVLTFSGSDTPLLPAFYEKNFAVTGCNLRDDKQLNFVNNYFPNISTPDELLQYKPPEGVINLVRTSRLDLLHSVAEFHANPCDSDSDHNMIVNLDKEKLNNEGLNNESEIPFNQRNNSKDVSWNDMFDTELLPNAVTKGETYTHTKQSVATNEINFKSQFPQDNAKTNACKIQNDYIVKNSNKSNETNGKVTKRKKKQSNIDKVLKTMKKGSEDKKPLFRKQKYTKTVKNWLNDVDSNNPVENESDLPNPEQNLNKNETIEAKKKIVQAKLVNKEGKMKFDKPQGVENTNIETDNSPSKDLLETENNVSKKDKVKRSKPKFVAPPVKSQIAVKDITFEIHIIDDSNSEEHFTKLSNEGDQEIYVILVYSNGFCQLNSQYTEDDCVSEGIMVCLNDHFYYCKKTEKTFNEVIGKFFQHKTVVCYDGKTILIFLKSKFDFTINFIINDTKIGGSLLDSDNPPESFAGLQRLLELTPQYTIATGCALQKAAWYTSLLKECATKLKCSLIEESLWKLFVDIEMRLLPIITDMELRGICVDVEKLKAMEVTLLKRMKAVEVACHRAAGRAFQATSAAQVRALVYDELQLDTKCNVKIRETLSKGDKSTSETMLRSLVSRHPLPKLILEYRRLHKAYATFVAGVAQHVVDGVIKPIWVQTAAATGRVAASNPNLQAIPKAAFSLQSEETDAADEQALHLRAVYAARAGLALLAADFRHVECRVFACAASDTLLLQALQSGDDLFRVLAAKWLAKQETEVTEEDRERTKRIVYASLYGAGTRKLMEILDVSYEQALAVVASFNRTFPSLKSFGRAAAARCAAAGGRLRTPLGRARRLPDVASPDPALRSHAERQAVNFLVQGSAADLCKMAMVRVAERLRQVGIQAWLLLQIHDELVWELAEADLLRAAAVVKEVMEKCGYECGLELPLPVALRGGRTWAALAPLALG